MNLKRACRYWSGRSFFSERQWSVGKKRALAKCIHRVRVTRDAFLRVFRNGAAESKKPGPSVGNVQIGKDLVADRQINCLPVRRPKDGLGKFSTKALLMAAGADAPTKSAWWFVAKGRLLLLAHKKAPVLAAVATKINSCVHQLNKNAAQNMLDKLAE